MDEWQSSWLDAMISIGNVHSNTLYEAKLPSDRRIQPNENGSKRERFIFDKYQRRLWYSEPREEQPPSQERKTKNRRKKNPPVSSPVSPDSDFASFEPSFNSPVSQGNGRSGRGTEQEVDPEEDLIGVGKNQKKAVDEEEFGRFFGTPEAQPSHVDIIDLAGFEDSKVEKAKKEAAKDDIMKLFQKQPQSQNMGPQMMAPQHTGMMSQMGMAPQQMGMMPQHMGMMPQQMGMMPQQMGMMRSQMGMQQMYMGSYGYQVPHNYAQPVVELDNPYPMLNVTSTPAEPSKKTSARKTSKGDPFDNLKMW